MGAPPSLSHSLTALVGRLHLSPPGGTIAVLLWFLMENLYMQSAYPLSRCPACKKTFRMEITQLASPPSILGLIACPHCGLKFQRFDPQYLKGPVPHATAR